MEDHYHTVEGYLVADLEIPVCHKIRILLQGTCISQQITVCHNIVNELLKRNAEHRCLQLNYNIITKNVINTVVAVYTKNKLCTISFDCSDWVL